MARLTTSTGISASCGRHSLLIQVNMWLDAGCDTVRGQRESNRQLLAAGNADCTRALSLAGRASGFEFIETFYEIGSGDTRPLAITPDLLGRSCDL